MNGIEISSIIIIIFIVIGVFLSVTSTIGLLRLPDIYSRAHATSKATTLGGMLILLATLVFFYHEHKLDARLILGILFVLSTSPIGGHFITRAAYYSGVPLWNKSVRDDLKEVAEENKKSTPNKE